MAEFCTKCAEKYGMKADIDVYRFSFLLRPGKVKQTDICEGCGLVAIRKTAAGHLQFLRCNSTTWEDYP